MKYRKCIDNSKDCRFNREKFAINGKVQCCLDEMADECLIAQSVIDSIEDFDDTKRSLSAISSRLSYAAHVINRSIDSNRRDVLPEIKRFAMIMYEHLDRIFENTHTLKLVTAFASVIKNWFEETFCSGFESAKPFTSVESIQADLFMLEMSLGLCVLPVVTDEGLDDLFF